MDRKDAVNNGSVFPSGFMHSASVTQIECIPFIYFVSFMSSMLMSRDKEGEQSAASASAQSQRHSSTKRFESSELNSSPPSRLLGREQARKKHGLSSIPKR